jgi:hypothetical protein
MDFFSFTTCAPALAADDCSTVESLRASPAANRPDHLRDRWAGDTYYAAGPSSSVRAIINTALEGDETYLSSKGE